MIKKITLLNLIIISFIIPHHCYPLDVLEKELLKKPQESTKIKSSETKSAEIEFEQNKKEKSTANTQKTKITPMPNYFFKNQEAVDFYRDSVNPTNEEGLLEYFNEADNLSAKTFKSPKSKEYLPPSSDDVRGFKIYKKNKEQHDEKITISTKEMPQSQKLPQKMFSSQDDEKANINCETIKDLEERQKCLKTSDPFMKK